MEIKRENDSRDNIEIEFRFYNIDENSVLLIKDELDRYNFTFEIQKIRKSDRFSILFKIENCFFDPIITYELTKTYKLPEENYGYWISITSEYGHGGFTIPNWLLDLYLKTKGQIDISYIIGDVE